MAALFGGKNVAAPLIDGDATKARILAEFEKLGQTAPEKGNVVIYLSGHGFHRDASWILCPHDFDSSNPNPNETGLSGGQIMLAISPLILKRCRILIILDSCDSGEFVKENECQFRSLTEPNEAALVVLASCAPTQSSWDGADHGLFTGAVLSALSRDGDLNERHLYSEKQTIDITLNEVRRSLSRNLRQAVAELPKLPGMEYSEQDVLADWSMSISDTHLLMEYVRPELMTNDGLSFFNTGGGSSRDRSKPVVIVPVVRPASSLQS